MVRNVKSKRVILDILATRENEIQRARDISEVASRVYKHDIHPKSISKLILPMQEDYDNIVRIKYDENDTQLYRCRYAYSWMTSGDVTANLSGIENIF